MQQRNPSSSDPYAPYHQHTQYYTHFPTQNPNLYPLQHHHPPLQIESQFTSAGIDPAPPGAESYRPSYSISHAGGVTYAQTVGAAAPADLLVQNWAAKEAVHQYGNGLYATGNILTQDGTHLLPAIANPTTWTNPTVQHRGPWKKPPKKTKIAQSAWCEVCKIECNTKDVLDQHKLGKKHLKNMEKLKAAATVPPPLPAHIATVVPPKPIIGPPENPNKENSQKKKKAETPEDLEMKRRKVLEGGAAVNAVRTCTLCNVVCNSDTVFRFHLAGQKHCSMLKKKSQPGI